MGRSTGPLPWIISLLLHGGLAVVLLMLPAAATIKPRFRTIELSNDRLPPPPEPPKPVEPPPAPKPPEPDLVAMQRQPKPTPQPEPQPEPPASPEPAKTEPPPDAVPPSFGLKLSGTATAAPGQGVQVPDGQTLKASPKQRRKPEDKDKPVAQPTRRGFKKTYEKGEQAPLAVATTMPKTIQVVKPEYPEKARELEIEGRVILELTVNGEGKVVAVRVIQKLHPLLDEAAKKAAMKMRFQPGTVNGTPVTLKIPVPFTFVLD